MPTAGPTRGPLVHHLHASQHDPVELPGSIYYHHLATLGYPISQVPQGSVPEHSPRLISPSINPIHSPDQHPQHDPHIAKSSSGPHQPMQQAIGHSSQQGNHASQPDAEPGSLPIVHHPDGSAPTTPAHQNASQADPDPARQGSASLPEAPSGASPVGDEAAQQHTATAPGSAGSGPPTGSLTGQKRYRNWAKTDAQRKFVPAWSESMPWLVYDPVANMAYCAACRWAGAKGIALGTDKFKKANFVDHQNTAAHKKNADAQAQTGRDAGAFLASTAAASSSHASQHAAPHLADSPMDTLEPFPESDGHPKMEEIRSLVHHLRLGQSISMHLQLPSLLNQLRPDQIISPWTQGGSWQLADISSQVSLEELQTAVQTSPFGSIILSAGCPGRHCDYLIIKVCFLSRNAPCTAFLALHKCSRDLSSASLTQAVLHATTNLLSIPAERLAVWQVGLATESACLTSTQAQGLTMELQLHSCPFLMAMPGSTAFSSLVPRELASLPLLARLEALISGIRTFFHANPTEAAPFLMSKLETSEASRLQQWAPGQVWWLQTASPLVNLSQEYVALVAFFAANSEGSAGYALNIYQELMDLEIILAVAAIQPLVAELVALSKECEGPDVQLWALATSVPQHMESLSFMYAPANPACGGQLLLQLLDLRQPGCTSPLSFTTAGVLTYTANSAPHQVTLTAHSSSQQRVQQMGVADVEACVQGVKSSLMQAAMLVQAGLQDRFASLQTLEAFAILQPAFWELSVSRQRLDETARLHMQRLAGMYGKAGVILNGRSLEPLVDAHALESQWERFHTIMTSWGSRLTSQQSITTAQAWQEILSHPTIPGSISAYCKLAQILLVLPLGSATAGLDLACMETLRTSSSCQDGLSQEQLVASMRIRCRPPRQEQVFARWLRYTSNQRS
ncbi:hypothetical protein WJX74_010998 [Apatococcus lobatus]|uniref:Uncharacterized protein n=1 Tax=Apatococcus lobatus TaxID=904363 RepID=A0AAW1SGT1_9CHLO